MKKITEAYYCDMCGKEFNAHANSPHRPIICSGYSSNFIPVHMHNPTYDEGWQEGLAWESVDLCPECADRACTIHVEVYKDGGEWRSKLSWRDARRKVSE